MSLSDFPVSYMSDVRVLTFSDRSADADNTRISRFPCMECPGMHRVFDSARPSSDSRYRRPTRGLPPHATGSAPRSCDFGAQYLACPSPDQRFTPGVTAKGAWPGATVGRYSFHVGLFHPLLHAGFNRRSLRVLNGSGVFDNSHVLYSSCSCWIRTCDLKDRRLAQRVGNAPHGTARIGHPIISEYGCPIP